jgi:MFS family permease
MLYSLGFMAGAITAPFTGQLIDHFGRKKAALLYCALEVCINHLEQYPLLAGLVLSRVVGGITTNLLSIVFEAWVDTEYQITCLPRERYEIIMRDSVIVSNLAAIASGYLSHVLAETLGPVGPFEGAVTCTAIAFAVIFVLWNENYGDPGKEDQLASSYARWRSTLNYIKADSRILRMCIIQGFSLGALHVFIFLWSPLLKEFASGASIGGQTHLFGMDKRNEPAYGLIFGSFMAAGVMGGLCSPSFRKIFLFRLEQPISESPSSVMGFTSEEEEIIMQRSVVLHGAVCYFVGSLLLMVPCLLSASNGVAFTLSLLAFVFFEFSVGMCSPCEGVIRSLYIPSELRGAIMALPTLIVNVSVGVAVVATERVSKQNSLAFVSVLLASAGFLQLSLISPREWTNIVGRMENAKYYPFCSINSIYSLVKGISIGKVAHIQGGYKFWEADKTS